MTTRDASAPHRKTSAVATVALGATIVLVAIGGYTRGSRSGLGCGERWPLCEGGALGGLLPRADSHMIVEWSHRWLASIVGVLALVTAVLAWREHRRDALVLRPALAALVVVGITGYLGRLVVKGDLDRDLVSAHLAVAMALLALLALVAVQARRVEGRLPALRPDRRWAARLGLGALTTLAVLLLGSSVHDQYVSGWPLVENTVAPDLSRHVVALHFTHRVVSGLAFVFVAWLAFRAHRTARPRIEVVLVDLAFGCYVVNVGLGAAHVFTEVGSSTIVVAHLGVAALAWACLVAATLMAIPRWVAAPEPVPEPSLLG